MEIKLVLRLPPPLDHDASVDVFPECHNEFQGHRDDCRLVQSPTVLQHAGFEPLGEGGIGLVLDPQPGDLDEGCPQPRISRLRDTLFTIDLAALPRCRRQACISGQLPAIIKMARQAFCPKDGCGFFADTLQAKQHLHP